MQEEAKAQVQQNAIQEVKISQLSTSEWSRILWGFVWRGMLLAIVVILGITIGALIMGFCTAAICHMFNISEEGYAIFAEIEGNIGSFCGCMFFNVVLITWILKSKFKTVRFALVRI